MTLALAGCGDLPHPFQGNPGATARRLAQPPPARLVVNTGKTFLGTSDSMVWKRAVAAALQDQEVPAVVADERSEEWRLQMTVELKDGKVVPHYTVWNPAGKELGRIDDAGVPLDMWLYADPAMFKTSAAKMAPQIANLLTSIEAQRQQTDPNSLLNRPARVYVSDVKGAPGDGNTALAKQMRTALPKDGQMVQTDPSGADYTVQGVVRMAVGATPGTQRVEIVWIVTDSTGREGGRIAQINEIPGGTLDLFWGDVAMVVAQQAAGGVRDVITNQLITHRKTADSASDSAQASAKTGNSAAQNAPR